jgi:HPt (histidine-containing phosphotransfer) domain-containing protein
VSSIDCSELERFLPPQRVLELLELFVSRGVEWRTELVPGNAGWRDCVHNIKGVAGNLGAVSLAAACVAAESHGAQALEAVRAELRAALSDAERYVRDARLRGQPE